MSKALAKKRQALAHRCPLKSGLNEKALSDIS
jgi:hypothetical protein